MLLERRAMMLHQDSAVLLHKYGMVEETVGTNTWIPDEVGTCNCYKKSASDIGSIGSSFNYATAKNASFTGCPSSVSWGLMNGDNFSIVINGYWYNTNYHSQSDAVAFCSGSGNNLVTAYSDSKTTGAGGTINRFYPGTNGTAISRKISVAYYNASFSDDTASTVKNVKCNLALTFEAATKTAKIYKDGELMHTETVPVNLVVSAFDVHKNTASAYCGYDKVYIYKGIASGDQLNPTIGAS